MEIYDKDGKRLYVYYFYDYEESCILVGYDKLSKEQLEEVISKTNEEQEKEWAETDALGELDLNNEDQMKQYNAISEKYEGKTYWKNAIMKSFDLKVLDKEANASMGALSK